ncbi:MAG: hypothetical protein M0T82_15635 [Desulfobacteraceae bacterium]|nr:hypothetical protein [Desulfobacteraceae bacterium]
MNADTKKKIKWKDWLFETWGMTCLKIKPPFGELEFKPMDADKDAAWELYVELLTRITTQNLEQSHGDEKTALASVYSLFGITREIIRHHGRKCSEFTKIAVIVLNQVVRPFTAKWHQASLEKTFDDPDQRNAFRKELAVLQKRLKTYTRMLADMAGVEDLTDMEPDR